MKTPRPKIFSSLLFTLLLCGGNELRSEGKAFTYQGRLTDNASPANGSYDLRFILFDEDQFSFPVDPILTNGNVAVDADGVALAAIQGLNQKLEQQMEQKETEITKLKQELAAIKRLLVKPSSNEN